MMYHSSSFNSGLDCPSLAFSDIELIHNVKRTQVKSNLMLFKTRVNHRFSQHFVGVYVGCFWLSLMCYIEWNPYKKSQKTTSTAPPVKIVWLYFKSRGNSNKCLEKAHTQNLNAWEVRALSLCTQHSEITDSLFLKLQTDSVSRLPGLEAIPITTLLSESIF